MVRTVHLAISIDTDGAFTDGFDDDTVSYEITIPGTKSLSLTPEAATRSHISISHSTNETVVEFRGNFLDGMSVLRALGCVSFDIPADIEGVESEISGEAALYVGERYRVGLTGRFLEFAGIRVVELPEVVRQPSQN